MKKIAVRLSSRSNALEKTRAKPAPAIGTIPTFWLGAKLVVHAKICAAINT
jgi:hypothetical protein